MAALGNSTNTVAVSDEVLMFKGRSLRPDLEQKTAGAGSGSVNSLVNLCIGALARNFSSNPVLDGIDPKQLPLVTAQLPLDLDITIAGPHVHDDNYWKRRCTAPRGDDGVSGGKGWRNCQIEEHGLTWKQLFFERNLQEELEGFDPGRDDIETLARRIRASEDYVFSLELRQLLSHLDLELVFGQLPNLTRLDLTYGVRQIGMKYERSLFGMKISDATSLAKCVKGTAVLTMLSLPCNLMDDDLLRMLMTGLITNNTITHLDVSHNKITNHGARLLAKLLGPRSVLTSLDLCDNAVHAEGGRYLGRALRRNDSLVELNLRLNRLTDEGGRMLFEGIKDNSSLAVLNVSSNSLASESARSFAGCLKAQGCSLAAVDLSCNELGPNDGEEIRNALQHQGQQGGGALTSLDLRMTDIPRESEVMLEIQRTVHNNELDQRRE